MADVTFKRIDEMETLYHGVARRARAELGVTGWGMQVYDLPPDWDGYPDHAHDAGTEEAGQEEVYIPLAGSATLAAGDERYDLRPGTMARVAPDQRRQILPGPDGIRFLAIGGLIGAHAPAGRLGRRREADAGRAAADQRGAYMITATPARQTTAPVRS